MTLRPRFSIYFRMREYIEKRGRSVTSTQLGLLIPAFNMAWDAISRRGGLLLGGSEERAMKDRVAEVIVDLVLDSNQGDDAQVIAETAVRLILTP